MHIDSYEFGSMTIDGRQFTNDLIVFPDTIMPNWWRREGHSLATEDLEEVIDYKPELLIVGTGASGVMKISQSTKDALREKHIRLLERHTDQAYKLFNEKIKSGIRVAGAFHLTC